MPGKRRGLSTEAKHRNQEESRLNRLIDAAGLKCAGTTSDGHRYEIGEVVIVMSADGKRCTYCGGSPAQLGEVRKKKPPANARDLGLKSFVPCIVFCARCGLVRNQYHYSPPGFPPAGEEANILDVLESLAMKSPERRILQETRLRQVKKDIDATRGRLANLLAEEDGLERDLGLKQETPYRGGFMPTGG